MGCVCMCMERGRGLEGAQRLSTCLLCLPHRCMYSCCMPPHNLLEGVPGVLGTPCPAPCHHPCLSWHTPVVSACFERLGLLTEGLLGTRAMCSVPTLALLTWPAPAQVHAVCVCM